MEQYLPTYKENSFIKVDFSKYYQNGYKIILTDLDNTITTYDKDLPDEAMIVKFQELKKIGFKIYIVSNSPDSRVKAYAKALKCDYIARAYKPHTKVTLSLLDMSRKDEMIMVGDQILTDIKFANLLGVDSILVDSINFKVQKWYTKINRLREKRIKNWAKKHAYDKYLLIRGEKDE